MYQKLSFDCGVFALSGEISPHLAYLVFSIVGFLFFFFALRREISHAFAFCMLQACPAKGIVTLQPVLPTICYFFFVSDPDFVNVMYYLLPTIS